MFVQHCATKSDYMFAGLYSIFYSPFYGLSREISSGAYSGFLCALLTSMRGTLRPSPLQPMHSTKPMPPHELQCSPLSLTQLPKHDAHKSLPFPMQ